MTTAKVYYDPAAYTSTGSTVDEHIKGIDDAIDALNTAVGAIDLTSDVTGTLPVANGGTGLDTLAAYRLIAGGTTGTGDVQQVGAGTSGHLLTSNGTAALPSFQALTVTDSVSGVIQYPEAQDYVVWINVPFAITVQTMTTRCSTGTCTLTAKKNTTAITGLANSVSTTEVTNTASSGNVFAAGDDLRLTVSSLSGAENVWFNVKFERTLP